MTHTVGISEMKVSSKPDDIIVTYSLGSCVGITIYDPELRVGGMAHCMLPISRLDPQKAKENPIMFTDTGVPALIQAVMDMGGSRRRLVAKVAEGLAAERQRHVQDRRAQLHGRAKSAVEERHPHCL